jgi:hypothetical protein
MIAIENNTGFKKNQCFVIVDKNNQCVDLKTFTNKRRRSYYFSSTDNPPNRDSQFETHEEALIALSKCQRQADIAQLKFNDEFVGNCYNGEGADVLGFDFVNGRIWIQSKDGSKHGYDYRSTSFV